MLKPVQNFDALIIGSGIAGLSAAAKLAEEGKQIAVITREKEPKYSNTYWAQGGIIYPTTDDRELVEDILRASADTANKDAAETLRERGGGIVESLLLGKVKTDFEKGDGGDLKKTVEAAHSRPRILYRGDFTGREIQLSLLRFLYDDSRFPNVSFFTGHTAIDLITPLHHGESFKQRYENNCVLGSYVFDQESRRVKKLLAKRTILATGGIGSLYLHHTNSEGARGDGHAMAKRAGAWLMNMEFIQFHPTTFFDSSSHRRFLISEAVRGEGGKLINTHGEQFMKRYHADEELAPRDVLARAIVEETIETKHECVFLDISHKDSGWIRERFPTIYQHCLQQGLDITSSPIPVVPAAHYSCGGVKTDLHGQTSLEGLYAVGEVACTGIHGANRLASTSLLEGLTWGQIAAEKVLAELPCLEEYNPDRIKDWQEGAVESEVALIEQDWMTLRQTMWNYVGITRTTNRLKRANSMFGELNAEVQRFYKNAYLRDNLIGLRNAVEVAHYVLSASLRNRHSIGCFYRSLG